MARTFKEGIRSAVAKMAEGGCLSVKAPLAQG
jgi:hypothetical protein